MDKITENMDYKKKAKKQQQNNNNNNKKKTPEKLKAFSDY